MPFQPTSYPGTLHHYTSRLTAFEHQSPSNEPTTGPRNRVLFIGGLGDGLAHPQYPSLLARHLHPPWTIVEVLLSSSYSGWTTSSLQKDADELARAVKYFRTSFGSSESEGAKVVLMGHSTGSQVCMEYLVGPWKKDDIPQKTLDRPKVDGVMLQAGISDREGLSVEMSKEELQSSIDLAKQWLADGRGEDIVPATATKGVFGPSPTARRWISLADIKGDDDYFSSDLEDEILDRTFGQVGRRGVPICIFLSGNDDNMPHFVDKEALIDRWKQAVLRSGGKVGEETGIVPGASHNLNLSNENVKTAFAKRVSSFVSSVGAANVEKL